MSARYTHYIVAAASPDCDTIGEISGSTVIDSNRCESGDRALGDRYRSIADGGAGITDKELMTACTGIKVECALNG